MLQDRCIRIGRWLGLSALLLLASPVVAQSTYTWNTTTTDNAWLNTGNWTGGPANTWPGTTANINVSNGNLSDTAVIGNFGFTAANGLGIDMGIAGGSLSLGAIQFTSTSGNLTIGNSSTTTAGFLQLNGATINTINQVLLANTSTTNDLTIGNTVGGGTSTMGLRMGNTSNVIIINSGRTITLGSVLSEANTGSTLTVEGGGTLVFRADSTWTGPLNVIGGSTVSIDSSARLNSSGTGLATLDGGTLQQTNPGSGGSFIAATRGIAIGSNGGTVNYSTAGSATIYAGTITGAGNTLTKTGAGEFRYQGAGTANSTFSKLVVNQGLFRIGSAAGSSELGFGAAPTSPLADAITLNGGAIGASLSLTLNTNRGITLGASGGTIDASAATLTIPSVISGSGALTKVGAQNVTLTGANTYTGGTAITGGTMLINGQTGTQSGTGTGAVAVNTGATLAGNGQAAGAVTINTGGRIIAGQGAAVNEQLSLGNNLTLANNSTIRAVVGNGSMASDTSLATGSSQLAVTGAFGRSTSSDRITIDLLAVGGNFDLTGNTHYTRRVVNNYGSLSNLTPGTYHASDNMFAVTSPSFGVDPAWSVLVGQGGNTIDVTFTPVPEPASVLAVGLAGLGLTGLVRRSRRARTAPLS